MSTRMDRRGFLKTSGMVLASTALPALRVAPQSAKPVLRIAHFSDVHMLGGDYAAAAIEGFERCLTSISGLKPRADLVFNTGDSIMDSLYADKGWAEAQWGCFTQVLSEFPDLEVHHILGNHDVWGWGFPDGIQEKTASSDTQFGKQLALDMLGMDDRYYCLDHAPWRFIALDSMSEASANPTGNLGIPYIGRLDDEQFDWLTERITEWSGPICILSHIPFMAGCEIFDGDNEASGNWVVPGAWVHIDARRLRNLLRDQLGEFPFDDKPPVLCLSGHTHQLEVLDHLGVRYMTDGSICGDWWQDEAHYLDTPRGYEVIDLFSDGSAEGRYITY